MMIGLAGYLLVILVALPFLGLTGWAYLLVALYGALAAAFLLASVGLFKMRTWAWWVAVATSVFAVVLLSPGAAGELACLARGPRDCPPGLISYFIVLGVALPAASLVCLAASFHRFHRKTTTVI